MAQSGARAILVYSPPSCDQVTEKARAPLVPTFSCFWESQHDKFPFSGFILNFCQDAELRLLRAVDSVVTGKKRGALWRLEYSPLAGNPRERRICLKRTTPRRHNLLNDIDYIIAGRIISFTWSVVVIVVVVIVSSSSSSLHDSQEAPILSNFGQTYDHRVDVLCSELIKVEVIFMTIWV